MVVGNRPAAAIAQPGSADFLTPDPRGLVWTGIDPHQTGTIAAVQTHTMPFSSTQDRMRTLSSKIIAIQMLFLTVALLSIGITFLVSWELEGGAAAINDADDAIRKWLPPVPPSRETLGARPDSSQRVRTTCGPRMLRTGRVRRRP